LAKPGTNTRIAHALRRRVFADDRLGNRSDGAMTDDRDIPIGDKIELNLAPDPEVIFELIKPRVARENIWVLLNGANQYRQVGGNDAVRVENTSVAGRDDHTVFDQ
jgi:hypothetical protein